MRCRRHRRSGAPDSPCGWAQAASFAAAPVLVREQLADGYDLRRLPIAGHDHLSLGIVVMDQLAANTARRARGDLAGLARLRMTDRNHGLDAVVAMLGDGAPDRNRFGTDRDAAEIGINIDSGDD